MIETGKQTLAMKRFDVDGLSKKIEDGYMTLAREPSDRAKKSFAPSGLGYGSGKCARQWFYAFTGRVIREDDSDSMGIANMNAGTQAHERIQKVFKDSGILIEAERKVNTIGHDTFPPILGFADLVINWQDAEAVGEIKTTSQESYVSKAAKNQPAGYHLLQVLIYMKVLGLDKGFLLYENKNNHQLLVLPVLWNVVNKKLADDAFEWMTKTYKAWQEGNKPTRAGKSESSVICKQCPFKTHCWADEEIGTIKLPVLEVPA